MNPLQTASPRRAPLSQTRLIGPSRPGLLKEMNARDLVALLRANNPCSRADLVRLSGLSAPTVSSVVAYLERKRLINQLGPGSSNGGRRPDMLSFNSAYGYVCGVDLGGSNIRLALADLDGKIAARWTVSTRGNRTPSKIVGLIHSGLGNLLRQAQISRSKLLAVGLGAPGITDVRSGIVRSAPHLSEWHMVPLRDLLESKLKVPAIVENDVNAAALGESWSGSAKGISNFVFIAIGTGIGAGIYINDRLYHGADWAAGEVGYLLIPGTQASPVLIERPGALEGTIGGNGIERAWRRICDERHNGKAKRHLRATEIFDLGLQGDAGARKLLQTSAQVLANAITNISLLLNTSLVVFGGAIGMSEALLRATREILERNDFARPRLAISMLGADAQLHGTIRLALDQVETALLA
jgi:predicted NBD/HSP70 family sugar kinase